MYRDLADFIYTLRDCYQHRHPLRGGTMHVEDTNGATRVAFAAVDVAQSLGPIEPRLLNAAAVHPGTVSHAGYLHLVPHPFLRAMTDCLERLLEDVISVADWPESEWTVPNSILKQQAKVFSWLWGS